MLLGENFCWRHYQVLKLFKNETYAAIAATTVFLTRHHLEESDSLVLILGQTKFRLLLSLTISWGIGRALMNSLIDL